MTAAQKAWNGARSGWRGRPKPEHACGFEVLVKEEFVSCVSPMPGMCVTHSRSAVKLDASLN